MCKIKKLICSLVATGTLLGTISAFAMPDWEFENGMRKGIDYYNNGLYYEAKDEFTWFWNANEYQMTEDQRQQAYQYLERAKTGITQWENRVTNQQNFYNRFYDIINQAEIKWNQAGPQIELTAAAVWEYEQQDALLNDVYWHLKATMPAWEFQELEKDEIWWIGYKENKALTDASEVYGGSMYNMVYYGSLADSTESRNAYLISLVRD